MVAALAAAGCGPSASTLQSAENSVYAAEYAEVWNAVVLAVRSENPKLSEIDAPRGVLVSGWQLVEHLGEDSSSSNGNAGSTPGSGSVIGSSNVQGGSYFRVAVFIKHGGPPWIVEVEGEGTLVRPGVELNPAWKHTDADEPIWVKARTDKVKVAIYNRLRKFARAREVVVPKDPIDPTPWKNLPPQAARLVAELRMAADKKDVDELRKTMIDDFVWSTGGAPSAESAASMWSADPMALANLVRAFDAGCAAKGTASILCPAKPAAGSYHAELELVGGSWRFVAFYLEE